MDLTDDLLLRYSRHILLPQVGVSGQARICDASVLVMGAGGLGCPVALYLGAAGVGRLVLADGTKGIQADVCAHCAGIPQGLPEFRQHSI